MNKFRLTIYILIVFVFVIIQFSTAFFLGNIIESLEIFNHELFIRRSSLIGLLLFGLLVLNIIKRIYSEKLKYDIVNQKKKRILRSLVNKPLASLITNEIGYYTNIFQGDINKYEKLYLNNILFFPERIMMIVLCVALLSLFDIRILILTILITLLMVVIPNAFNKNIEKYSKKYGNSVNDISKDLNNYINNSSEYLLFDATDASIHGFDKRNESLKYNKLKLYFTIVAQNNFSLIFSLMLSVGILIYASYLKDVSSATLQISSLSISFIIGLFSDNVLEFVDNYNKFKTGRTFKDKLEKYEVLNEKRYNKNLIKPISKIIYSNFSVTKNEKVILKNINLTFKKNKKYLIIGESGSGKSTLIQSLLGLSEFSGEILINDISVKELNYTNLYDSIAYIDGNGRVFNASLIENITLFENVINQELIQEIFELLELSTLPKNIDNNKLSGGERQRILIARALYRNCQIIIMDEATSELDYKTQEKIEKYFAKEKNKTVINISHKISDSLKEYYDQIIKIEQEGAILM